MPEDAPGNPGAARTEPPARQVAFYRAVREMQAKLHRWAGEDPPAGSVTCSTSCMTWSSWPRRGCGSAEQRGAKTPGIDGATVADIENWTGGVGVFLEHIRAAR